MLITLFLLQHECVFFLVYSFHTVAYEELLDDHKLEGDFFSSFSSICDAYEVLQTDFGFCFLILAPSSGDIKSDVDRCFYKSKHDFCSFFTLEHE